MTQKKRLRVSIRLMLAVLVIAASVFATIQSRYLIVDLRNQLEQLKMETIPKPKRTHPGSKLAIRHQSDNRVSMIPMVADDQQFSANINKASDAGNTVKISIVGKYLNTVAGEDLYVLFWKVDGRLPPEPTVGNVPDRHRIISTGNGTQTVVTVDGWTIDVVVPAVKK